MLPTSAAQRVTLRPIITLAAQRVTDAKLTTPVIRSEWIVSKKPTDINLPLLLAVN